MARHVEAARRERGTALLAVLTVALTLLLVAPARAQNPRGFFGVQAWDTPTAADFDAMGRGRVDVFRFNLEWSRVEPLPGRRAWGFYDAMVAAAARNGIALLPVLYGTPAFAAPRPTNPPITRAARSAFAGFVADAVARYGHGGSFWRAHPELPPMPISTWQVWNEPNFAAYWYGHPNAAQYASLLSRARRTILRVDRRARVMLAGLPESRGGVPIVRYLDALYHVRGARRLFDVVAINPYARDDAGVVGAVQRVRAVMNRHGDRRKGIWLTELGWATGGPASPFRTSLAGQARLLTHAYRTALRLHVRYRLDAVVWFALRDRRLMRGEHDWWAPHTGLFTFQGRMKPAWRAFTNLTGGLSH
jgi:polysaccharide biosynthesis protein PslG